MERSVEEIQAEILAKTQRLEAVIGELGIPGLMKELEAHFPPDTELMDADDVCPSVASEVYGDLAHGAAESLKEAVEMMRKAAGRNATASRGAWKERRLREVRDPSVRSMLALVLDELARKRGG